MKSWAVLLWILSVTVQHCISSTSISPDSTIYPSSEQASNADESTLFIQETKYTSSITFTYPSTQSLTSLPTKTVLHVTASSIDLSFMSESNNSPGLMISASSIKTSSTAASYSDGKSFAPFKTIDESIEISSTMSFDSVIQLQTSFSKTLQKSTFVQLESSFNNTLPLSSGEEFETSLRDVLTSSIDVELNSSLRNDLLSSIHRPTTNAKLSTTLLALPEKSNTNIVITSTKSIQRVGSIRSDPNAGTETNISKQEELSTSTNMEATLHVSFPTSFSESATTLDSSGSLVHSANKSFIQTDFIHSYSAAIQTSSSLSSVSAFSANTITEGYFLSSEFYSSVSTTESHSHSVSSMSPDSYLNSVISDSFGFSRNTNSDSVNKVQDISKILVVITHTSAIISSTESLHTRVDPSLYLSSRTDQVFSTTSKQPVTTYLSKFSELTDLTSATVYSKLYSTWITPTPASKSLNISTSASEAFTSIQPKFDTNSITILSTVLSMQTTPSHLVTGSLEDSLRPSIYSTTDLTASELSGKSSEMSLSGTGMLKQESSLSSYLSTSLRTSLVPELSTSSRDIFPHFLKTSNTDVTFTFSAWNSATLFTSMRHSFISESERKSTSEYEILSSSKILNLDKVKTKSTFVTELQNSVSSSLSTSVTLPVTHIVNSSEIIDVQTLSVTEGPQSTFRQILSKSDVGTAKTVSFITRTTETEHVVSYSFGTNISLISSLQPSEYPMTLSSLNLAARTESMLTDTMHATETPTLTQYITSNSGTAQVFKTLSSVNGSISTEYDVSLLENTKVTLTQSSIPASQLQTLQLTSVYLNPSLISSIEATGTTNEYVISDLLYSRTSIFSSSLHSLSESTHVLLSPTGISKTQNQVPDSSRSTVYTSEQETRNMTTSSISSNTENSVEYQTISNNKASTLARIEPSSSLQYVQTTRFLSSESVPETVVGTSKHTLSTSASIQLSSSLQYIQTTEFVSSESVPETVVGTSKHILSTSASIQPSSSLQYVQTTGFVSSDSVPETVVGTSKHTLSTSASIQPSSSLQYVQTTGFVSSDSVPETVVGTSKPTLSTLASIQPSSSLQSVQTMGFVSSESVPETVVGTSKHTLSTSASIQPSSSLQYFQTTGFVSSESVPETVVGTSKHTLSTSASIQPSSSLQYVQTTGFVSSDSVPETVVGTSKHTLSTLASIQPSSSLQYVQSTGFVSSGSIPKTDTKNLTQYTSDISPSYFKQSYTLTSDATLERYRSSTVFNSFSSISDVRSISDNTLFSSEIDYSFTLATLTFRTSYSNTYRHVPMTSMHTDSFSLATHPISAGTSLKSIEASATKTSVIITDTPETNSTYSSSIDETFSPGTIYSSTSISAFTKSRVPTVFSSVIALSPSISRDVNSQISDLFTGIHTTNDSRLYETSNLLTSSSATIPVGTTTKTTLEKTTPSLAFNVSISSPVDSLSSTEQSMVMTTLLHDSESISISTFGFGKTHSGMTKTEAPVQSKTEHKFSATPLSDMEKLITLTSLSYSLTSVDTLVTMSTVLEVNNLNNSTGLHTGVPVTTVASIMSQSVSSSLQSPLNNLVQSSSLQIASSSETIFVTPTGMKSTTLQPSTQSFSELSLPFVVASSTATLNLSDARGEHSTMAFDTIGNTSVNFETSVKLTISPSSSFGIPTIHYTTVKSFGGSNKSVSFFTEPLASSLITSTNHFSKTETLTPVQTSVGRGTLETSKYDVSSILLDTNSYSSMSIVSLSQSIETFVLKTSSNMISAIETSTTSLEVTDILTPSVLSHSKTYTGSLFVLSTSTESLVSPVGNTAFSESSSVIQSSMSPSNEVYFSATSTKKIIATETLPSPLSSLPKTMSSVLSSGDAGTPEITTTVDLSFMRESSRSISFQTSLLSLESSLLLTPTLASSYTYSPETLITMMNETATRSEKFTHVLSPMGSFTTFGISTHPYYTVSIVSTLTTTTSEEYSKVKQTTVTESVYETISFHSPSMFASVTDHFTRDFKASTSYSSTHLPSPSIFSTDTKLLSTSKFEVSAPKSSNFHTSSAFIETPFSESQIISDKSSDASLKSLSSDVTSSALQTFNTLFTTLSLSVDQKVSSILEKSAITITPASTTQDDSSVLTNTVISPMQTSLSTTNTSVDSNTIRTSLQVTGSSVDLSTIKSSLPMTETSDDLSSVQPSFQMTSMIVESTQISFSHSSSSMKSVPSVLKMSTLTPTSASKMQSTGSASIITDSILATPDVDATSRLTMRTTMTSGSTNVTGIQISTESIAASLSLSSLTLDLLISSLSSMSASSSIRTVTSRTITITTEPPQTTTLNGTNAKEANWVRTVLKIQRSKNISDPSFVREMERSFANAYNEAFIRERLIQEGKFEPLQRRRRRKRYTSVGDASVHIHDMSRVEDTTTVTAIYAVERSGKVLAAEEAAAALDVLNTQELAIILKQVVDLKAESYSQTEKHVAPEEDVSQLWLIGVIVGSVVGGIIVIWIIVCIYCKCCRQKDPEDDAEPELTAIHTQSSKRKVSQGRPLPSNPPKKTVISPGSKFNLKKGRTYEINDTYVPEAETDGHMLLKSPTKKKPLSPKSSLNGSASVSPVVPKKELVPPTAKKGRRNSRNSIGPLQGEFALSNGTLKANSSKGDRSQLFQSSVSEDSEDTKKQLRKERKKNKERLRELYGHETEPQVQKNETTESKVLGMPNTSVPSFVIESRSPAKEPLPSPRRHSDGNTSGDENLAEARSRMHKLLDDAFSLISPRTSVTEDDLGKLSGTTSTNALGDKSKGSGQSTMSSVDIDKAKETIRGFTNPAYGSSYSQFLETWSPYRASDQVALISMPYKPEPTITKLGGKPDKRSTMSKSGALTGRRPAVHLDQQASKSVSDFTGPPKYTTSSPKPIVLRTKDNVSNGRIDSARSNKASNDLKNNRTISATAFDRDVLIQGSGTLLTDPVPQANAETKDLIEMQAVRRNRSNSIRKHRVPEKSYRHRDEVDVIQNIKPEEATDNLIKSLRDEIKGSKAETEYDINRKPIKKRNRKAHSKPMTDIV